MPVSQDFINYVSDQLSEFGDFEAKKMFGGVGFFRDKKMFAMISSKERFYLKADEHNQADFEARGCESFSMESKRKGMPYWEAPADIVEDKSALAIWAAKSYEAALRKKKK